MEQKTIMVIEDDRDHSRLMETSLKLFRYNVITADSGENVIDVIRNGRPDLILLDVMMPGKSGYDVIMEIRKAEDIKNIPVVFVSAKASAENVQKGMGMGANDYITKPFDPIGLAERVSKYVN